MRMVQCVESRWRDSDKKVARAGLARREYFLLTLGEAVLGRLSQWGFVWLDWQRERPRQLDLHDVGNDAEVDD